VGTSRHAHHIVFWCIGGTDEAANLLHMQALLHTGRGVGLHWHILRHMKASGALKQATYKGLTDAWGAAKASKTAMKEFSGALRRAYDDYFRRCTPDVRKVIGEVLDRVLPVGG